jgi:hypothetical protein
MDGAFYLLLAFLGAVVIVGAGPFGGLVLRARANEKTDKDLLRDGLEAAKLAKYREIRDVQLEWQIGALSDEDFEARCSSLHAEAIAILKQLERLDSKDVGV